MPSRCSFLFSLFLLAVPAGAEDHPDILFIAVDDLNDWIGCLGGHPQSLTPNFDRLAESGVLFSNAHCPAAACNPSRTAIMTGIAPHRSGLYANGQKMREILPDADILPQHFRNQGYRAEGSGKMLHYFIDARSWDQYFPEKSTENPFPPTFYPEERPVNLPRGGPWQYVETDWAALDVSDEEFGGDWAVTEWVSKQLLAEHRQPLFLACGIYRPHEPWFVPTKYFKPFPLEGIQLPPDIEPMTWTICRTKARSAGPTATFPIFKRKASGSRESKDIWPRSISPMPCWGGCSMPWRRGRIVTRRSLSFGATMVGIWARKNIGKSSPPGGFARGCRS